MFELTTMNVIADFLTPDRISLLIRVGLMLVIGIPLIGLIKKVLTRILKDKLTKQTEVMILRFVKYTLVLILLMMILNEFGFKLSAILGAAGIFGVAIGFASQASISNIISGIFLISEKPFVIGDVIEVNGQVGTIQTIDMLSLKLKTFDGRFVRVPNETMIKNDVINLTRFDIRRSQISLSVAYKEDLPKVMDILREIADTMPEALKEPAHMLLIDSFGDSGININFGVWTATSNVFNMRNQLYLTVKERFDKEGIEIPFPHLSIYAGSESEPIKFQQIQEQKKEV
ncbi:MAG: mechanosensitive ion channel family protein [Candidatus Cloacimonadaceae bacterium]|jgi:small-conductance mechanosensitive channel|nr:mechanosensitive ion channel family protein [Candidatus Cloacimonadota bacterium]MDY0126556.1 mechanosensitive ion channel family protein [Candidatus Cloacimonadaceae bacterium]MCB5254636.1 mechanosensitive ion channel family protein [Candidatus Cloacimonadota bacterium]MCK9177723.1 mechanosensitive ion channel family protein [Candidatus Cloacimonadota bacterium]MCK9241897.1 mechanosensitive ion channel family protein [Candidatus Cloacimonadota bacterium]